MKIKWNKLFALARKDLIEVTQNKSVWMPMVILPLIFVVIIPLAVTVLPLVFPSTLESLNDPDLRSFMGQMPPALTSTIRGLDGYQSMVVLILGYLFAPFMLIFPIMFSTVVASESFAGEHERKTIEALLYTSATDRELFLGKVLAALIPALGITWGGFLLYSLIVNLGSLASFGYLWFPLPSWYPLIFWITPALALLGVSFTVLISAKVKTFMGAYQSSASLVIIIVGLFVGQLTGILFLTVPVGLLVGLVMWVIAILLTGAAVRGFNRSALLASISK
jgi:ABC-2 type transport system permease protein